MDTLTYVLVGCLLALYGYALVRASSWRQVLALALGGALAVALIAPPSAQAQGSLLAAIDSVLNVINGLIQTALNSVHSVRSTVNSQYQQAIWPVAQIDQARAMVTGMIGQYRDPMQTIFNMHLNSATLATPLALENAMRNHQIRDFTNLATLFASTYGTVPTAAAASPEDRTMMDMDDALALDNLKLLKESDAAGDLTLQAAKNIENGSSHAAPGSAPFLTASAAAASIISQALTQKMLAAELREEGAQLAHENAIRKRGAEITGNLRTEILKLLERK